MKKLWLIGILIISLFFLACSGQFETTLSLAEDEEVSGSFGSYDYYLHVTQIDKKNSFCYLDAYLSSSADPNIESIVLDKETSVKISTLTASLVEIRESFTEDKCLIKVSNKREATKITGAVTRTPPPKPRTAVASVTPASRTTPATSALAQCRDKIDNDDDGKIDHPADPGCSSSNDNDEKDAAASAQSAAGTPRATPATPSSRASPTTATTPSRTSTPSLTPPAKPITGARADTSVPTPITPAQPAAETPRTGTSVAPATAPTTAPRAGAPATTASAQPAAEAPRAITITSTAPTTSTVPRATTPAPSQPTTAPRAGTSTTPITQIQPITGARAGTSTAIPAPSTVAAPRAGATPTQSATDRISTPLASTPASRTAASTGTIPVSASTRTTTTPSRTTPTIPAALSQCSDSIDNDGDGFVDYDQELVGCDSLEDNDETNPVAEDVTVEDTTQSIPEEPSGGGGETTAAPSAPAFLETVPIPEAPFEELPPEDLSAEETKPEVQQATAESTMIGRAEKTIERLTKGETIVIDTSQVIAEIKSVEITARKEVHGTAFSIKKTEKSAIPPPAAKNIISTFHIEGPESDKVIEVKVEKEKYTDKTTANCFDIKHNKWRPGKVQEKKSDEKYVYLKVALPCRN